MNSLVSRQPSPIAARLSVAATLLLLLHLVLTLQLPMATSGFAAVSWIVGLMAGTAFAFALFGHWPPATSVWSAHHAA